MNPKGSHAGGAPRKYDRDDRTKMRELIKLGLSPYRVAVVVGCSHATVRREIGTMKP
jgi:hypothetical protein